MGISVKIIKEFSILGKDNSNPAYSQDRKYKG